MTLSTLPLCGRCQRALAMLGTLLAMLLIPAFSATAADVLHIKDGLLTRNGEPFEVKGVSLVGLNVPSGFGKEGVVPAREHITASLFEAAKSWHANTIRFNISQAALDPQSSSYSQAFVAEAVRDVQLARSMGFIAIVEIQDEGNPDVFGLPTTATSRALATLAAPFKDDQGVMIGLFNEPGFGGLDLTPTAQNWNLWLQGGTINGRQAVGMQTLVNELRNAGVHNVLIIEGIVHPQTLEGVPVVADPLHDYMYATHPYLSKDEGFTEDQWEQHFGYLVSQHRPVLIDEWAAYTKQVGWCKPSPDSPMRFLAYLKHKGIGVIGWAFNMPGTIVQDYNGTPTTFEGKKCRDEDGGPGVLFQQQFAR